MLAAAFSNRLDELRQLSAKETAVNANLQLEQTATVVLDGAIELLGGVSGAVYLRDARRRPARCTRREGLEGPGRGRRPSPDGLVARGRRGRRAPRWASRRRHRHATRWPARVMAVPLVRRRRASSGVLLVRRGPDGLFSEYDVRVLARFAEHSAPAIAHAALYEGERRHVAELVERDRTKSSFVAMVSHEIKAPLAAIIGAVRTLQRRDLPPEHVASFLEMIEKQGERLSRLVEDVLELRKAEGDPRSRGAARRPGRPWRARCAS